MEDWEQFEHDLAKEFGLKRVAGSGNKWYNKLDVSGKETRWSLKCTGKEGFRVDKKLVAEAILATGGIGGTAETPIWAIRILGFEDFIIMRASDWKRFMMEKTEFIITPTKAETRRQRASTPQLFRREDGDNSL